MALYADARYGSQAEKTRAGALLCSRELAGDRRGPPHRVVADDPRAALARLAAWTQAGRDANAGWASGGGGVHPLASVDPSAVIGEGCSVGPFAVVGAGVVLREGSRIGAHAVLGPGVVVGRDSVLHPSVTVYPGVKLGARVTVHAGARLGSDGFGYALGDGNAKVPQFGGLEIGDDVEIGANCAIDRGSIGSTRLGCAVKLDNLVHIAHNARIGEESLLAAQVGIAGSTRIGARVLMGGQAGAAGHLEIADGAVVTARAGVTRDVSPGARVAGFPARERGAFLRGMAALLRLRRWERRLRALERRVFGRAPSFGATDRD